MTRFVLAMWSFVAVTAAATAQQMPDFSGVYVFSSSAGSDSRTSAYPSNVMFERVIKKVVQDSNSVEISFQTPGRGEVTSKYKLDGSETPGTEPDGTPTVERAEIKGNRLIIRSSIKIRRGALKGVPILKTQKWELSKDLKTLTVHEQIQAEGMHVMDDLLTVTYIRQ